jgi:hypothetical protein
LPAKSVGGNDVPEVFGKYIDSQKIECVLWIGPLAAAMDGAGISALVPELGRFDLDAKEAAVVLEDEVVLGRVSPRLGDMEVVFGSGGHKSELDPLTPAFWLFDFHCKFVHGFPK